MKKSLKILFVCALFAFCSCTEQEKASNFGGESSIDVPYGEEVINAFWKDDDVWYLTKPMDDNYNPQVKVLRQQSPYGLYRGTVYFYEHK